MKLELARLFVLAAGDVGGDIEIMADYSGRGMYGAKTAAVTFEGMSNLMMLCAYIGTCFDELVEKVECEPGCSFTEEDFFDAIRELRFDSMGRSGSVAY
jgi:hypothetical protein